MNIQDFNRLKEISKELNHILLRNNLTELQLRAENNDGYYSKKVMLLTREEYKDDFNHYKEKCRISYMRHNQELNETEEMNYEDYINYK